jgi:hypothetical protein
MPRVSLNVQYARRWYGNLRVTDDQAVTAADYDRFTVTVPTDSRLPNSGGSVTSFDISATGAARAPNYLVTLADNYGLQTEHFDGVNISVQARLQNGLLVQAGTGPGRVITNDCEVVAKLPEMLQAIAGNPSRASTAVTRPLERCEQNNGWRTGVSGLASYTIPKIDVQVSGTFQNQPGAQLDANANTCSGVLTAQCTSLTTTLGRGFSNAAAFRPFNIVPAGEIFIERLNQIDFRVAKLFRFNTTKTSINFDFYNVTNSNSVITENATYTLAGWRTPQSILLPRLFKISAQFDF